MPDRLAVGGLKRRPLDADCELLPRVGLDPTPLHRLCHCQAPQPTGVGDSGGCITIVEEGHRGTRNRHVPLIAGIVLGHGIDTGGQPTPGERATGMAEGLAVADGEGWTLDADRELLPRNGRDLTPIHRLGDCQGVLLRGLEHRARHAGHVIYRDPNRGVSRRRKLGVGAPPQSARARRQHRRRPGCPWPCPG